MADIPPVIAEDASQAPEPVTAAERLGTLDVLRGFALFGILLVNMNLFSRPIYHMFTGAQLWDMRSDAVADGVVRFLAEGKFYLLFSFLFGLGTALQMERVEQRGAAFARLFRRRLLGLLGIGLIHAFLIWEGDILILYALLGFLLLAFRRRKPKTLLVWAGLGSATPVVIYAFLWLMFALASLVPEAARGIEAQMARQGEDFERMAEENLQVFTGGSFAEIFFQRAANVGFSWRYMWFYAPTSFAMFLMGLYAGQRRLLQEVQANAIVIRRMLVWGLAVGLPASAGYAICFSLGNPLEVDFVWLLAMMALAVGGPMLCLGYASAIMLLLQQGNWARTLRPIGSVGRMALSNYLLQSVVCTMIFNAYGLGLYGSVGRVSTIGLAVVIYAAQVPFSVWWLRRFEFGPAEWLWRTLTYGRCQPMRRQR